MEKFVEIFKAVGDETRLRILNLLIKSEKPICACEIVDSLEKTQYNVSKHIKLLKNVGLIKESKEGRWKYYSLNRGSDLFINNILQTISSIARQTLIEDYERLKKRFEIRKDGKCVLGVQNPHLLSIKKI